MSQKKLKDSDPPDSDDCVGTLPDICTDDAKRGESFLVDAGKSLLNIAGIGGLFNFDSAADKLKQSIQDANDCTQQVTDQFSLAFAQEEVSFAEDTFKTIVATNTSLQSFVTWSNEVLNEKSELNTIYIIGSFSLLLVTIFFLLISNAFKY